MQDVASDFLRSTLIAAALGLCVGCQSSSMGMERAELRGSHDSAMPAAVEPRSAERRAIHRRVLLTSRAAPLRAEAARELGDHLADDREVVWAVSIATNDGNPTVERAARRALVRIFDARPKPENDDADQLEELEKVAQQEAQRLGRGAITVIKWLWENVYFWPA